ncbi:MAG TPA: tRNA epoxyqueuosine(34) reductase QueG [Chitinophagaceae bacterium]|nr:tRNA epoxyqueuosine(34) reductase QueG [Chitinophagaceae bacterium]
MLSKVHNTHIVKEAALSLGFELCGVARAQKLDDDALRLEKWLRSGMHGSMKYMENYFELRIDPQKLVPGARSVITLLLNYFPAQMQNSNSPRISKYAYGKDYHDVIKSKLKSFLQTLREKIGDIQGRGFVDSAPVLERTWAQKSGIGWIGKNGNLITRQSGSFFFIATLITDLELEYDDPFAKDYCGNCTKCVDTCPTNAILPDKVVDGSKCISYFTIELKDMMIPSEMRDKFENWMFGCDVCQDVCPWNRFSKPTNEMQFAPIYEVLNFSFEDWDDLSEESFKKIFKDSAVKRAKFTGIKRNLRFLSLRKWTNDQGTELKIPSQFQR